MYEWIRYVFVYVWVCIEIDDIPHINFGWMLCLLTFFFCFSWFSSLSSSSACLLFFQIECVVSKYFKYEMFIFRLYAFYSMLSL